MTEPTRGEQIRRAAVFAIGFAFVGWYLTKQQIDPIWALFVYTVVASIVFTISYFCTRNARRAAFHAGIGIIVFTALSYLGGLPEHWIQRWIDKHVIAFDLTVVFLALVTYFVLKLTVAPFELRWWQTLLAGALLFWFPALIGGVIGDLNVAAARFSGWSVGAVALAFVAVIGAATAFWLYVAS